MRLRQIGVGGLVPRGDAQLLPRLAGIELELGTQCLERDDLLATAANRGVAPINADFDRIINFRKVYYPMLDLISDI